MAASKMSSAYQSYDLDNEATFQQAQNVLKSDTVQNFAVHFDAASATCAANLSCDQFRIWNKQNDSRTGVRWIHFWVDQSQQELVEYLASEYEISPRLLGFLCPVRMHASMPSSPKAGTTTKAKAEKMSDYSSMCSAFEDVEKTANLQTTLETTAKTSSPAMQEISVADIVNNMWHFSTIDWGQRYVYIGMNMLSIVPDMEHDCYSPKPSGQRLWTSLVLCDDGTVISSCERPAFQSDQEMQALCFKVAKRHTCNVFRHLSRTQSHNSQRTNALSQMKIRPDLTASSSTSDPTPGSDLLQSSSLLFYYLFDDWMTTYALISRREHPYQQNLEQVRQDLVRSPDVNLLEKLHSIGRQLTVLKLMYQGYAQIILRLLKRHNSMVAARHMLHSSSYNEDEDDNQFLPSSDQGMHMSSQHQSISYGCVSTATTVRISLPSLVRFERLLDRIHLYALTEIEQCLAEKESLVFMTFNLLTLWESKSVEKLTRTTIVLAKATIFFLPVSLLTAYFSIQVSDIQNLYSLTTYWASFGVVAAISILFLIFFSAKTDTEKGTSFYRQLHRLLWRKTKGKANIRQRAYKVS